jgi:hypothetical protein
VLVATVDRAELSNVRNGLEHAVSSPKSSKKGACPCDERRTEIDTDLRLSEELRVLMGRKGVTKRI